MTKEKIYKQVANELGLTYEDVRDVYQSYWRFIKSKITSLPLKERLSEEEYSKLRTSFMLPSLGKLFCDYDRYKCIVDKYDKNQKRKAIGESDDNNNG